MSVCLPDLAYSHAYGTTVRCQWKTLAKHGMEIVFHSIIKKLLHQSEVIEQSKKRDRQTNKMQKTRRTGRKIESNLKITKLS